VVRYCRDLGWTDPPDLPATSPPSGPRGSGQQLDTLDALAARVAECTACRLHQSRNTTVFGEGNASSGLLFIGEGPGAEEDRTGRPFVGQAGQLLDRMLAALGLDRGAVYIANTVKCRPPGNRDPKEDEMDACAPFLDRQIELLAPRVIVALGRVAAQRLTGSSKPLGALRGRCSSYRGVPLLATYHPAYLLRTPVDKRKAWEDLKLVRKKLDESE
jgi:DNA polymerase